MTALLNSELLRQARLAAGITERGLARQLGTSPLRIRRLEAGIGHETLTLGLLVELSAAIAVAPGELLDTDSQRRPQSVASPTPMSLPEARLLHRALDGEIPMVARGLTGAALARLITSGAVTAERPDPTAATRIAASPETLDALDSRPQRDPMT